MVHLCFPKVFLTQLFMTYYWPSTKTSTIPTYLDNPKKRFHLKDTTKNSIETMEVSSLLNTDLGNINVSDSSMI